MKILSTLLKADEGTASVNGFDVATQAAEVRELSRHPHRRVHLRHGHLPPQDLLARRGPQRSEDMRRQADEAGPS